MQSAPILITVAGLVGLAACSKGGDGSSAKTGESADESKEACTIGAAKAAELVTGKTAQLIAPLAQLKLGMSAADAKKACPKLFQREDKTGTFTASGSVGKLGTELVFARLHFAEDKLASVELDLPAEIDDALVAAWSAPKASASTPPAHAWFDDATKTRAILAAPERGHRTLAISTYLPIDAFVELDPTRLPFKPDAVLGKNLVELMKAFPQYAHPDRTSKNTKELTKAMMADFEADLKAKGFDPSKLPDLQVELPAMPFSADAQTHVITHFDDHGHIRDYGVWFRTKGSISDQRGWPDAITEIVKKLDERWGGHKVVKEVLGDQTNWYDPKSGIRAYARIDPAKPDELDIDYIRYKPLAELFGAPGPVWGFEKAERPLIGAKPDELAAIYGDAFKHTVDKDGNDTATLELPPTDYAGTTARTTILMFVANGKVRQWNMSIPFKDYEPARAEYEAMLATKLGQPKPARHEHFIYGGKQKVDVQYSKYTHELDVSVE